MKINDFKKIEKEIEGQNFNKNYANVNIIMIILSYLGHVASISLAYFFVSKIIAGTMLSNPLVIFFSSVIILAGIELLKRDIFNKFSIQYLKDKVLSYSILPITIVSLFLISASFYSTINGSKEFSNKGKIIELKSDSVITQYKDSLTMYYSSIVENYEDEIIKHKIDFDLKDKEQTELESESWLNSRQVNRIKYLKEEKNRIRDDIEKLELRIEKSNEELKDKILKEENKVGSLTKGEKEENIRNSFIFIMLSAIIEIVILIGVYFSVYYKFRSYKEFKKKIEKDPNYQKWFLYDRILSIILNDETKINQKLPSSNSILDICKVNDVIVTTKDITNFMKILNNLNIIRTSGNSRFILKSKENAREIIKEHFNID